jgi:tight adherence protein B
MDPMILVAVLVGLVIMLFFIGTARILEPPDTDRLQDYLRDRPTPGSDPVPRRAGSVAGSAGEMMQGMDKLLHSLGFGARLSRALQRADLQMTATEYLFIWLLSIAGSVILGYVLTRSALPALLLGLAGAFIPSFILFSRRTKRLRAFDAQLPNILMQLSGSLRAGYGLLQAIDFVAHEMPPPAGREFAQVVRDVKLGRSTLSALEAMLERVDSEDFRLIITAMRIQAETGGNLAEILDTIAETIRERVRIKGELRALTSQQRMAGYVLAALPILVFLVLMLLNPTYESRLFAPGPTLCIPIGSMVSMLIGFLVIRRIVAIEV